MSKIIKTVSLIILSPIITFGLYVIAHGHLTPGGGFQGGVIIASAIAILLVAFEDIKFSKKLLSFFESLGLALFISIAFLGIINGTFFNNFLANNISEFLGRTIPFGINTGHLNSGGVIPLMNIAVGTEVASALSLAIILMIKNRSSNQEQNNQKEKDD